MSTTSSTIHGFIRSCVLGALLLAAAGGVFAAEIIFRPEPGLNNGADNGSALAGKDASGGQCDNPAANYGDQPFLYCAPQSNCNSCNISTWIRFDVSTLPADVEQVFVGFTHGPLAYCYSNCEADFYFSPVTSEWNEMTISRATPPSVGAPMVGPIHLTSPSAGGLREYDITDMYRQWKANPSGNFGFEISSPDVGCNNASVAFYTYSSDASDPQLRPYLRVVTADAPPPPPPPPNPIPTLSTVGTLLTGLGLVTLAWRRRRTGR